MTTLALSQDSPSRTRQAKALAWTVGIHALLLLLFVAVRYSPPAVQPPVEELGMEVNLGSSADGFGTDQPEITGDPAPDVNTAAVATPTDANTEVEESDDADAVPLPVRAKPVRKSMPTPVTPPTRVPDKATAVTPARKPKVLFPGSKGSGGNGATTDRAGGAEGNTQGSGDRGVPGGTPGASNYEGSPGKGTGGIGHTLRGRNIIAPRLEGSFRNGGTVRIRVTVNRAGAIVNSTVVSGSGELTPIARQKLREIRFNTISDGPEEQFGVVTFVFKTQS
jgi:hypothetical protein